MMLKNLKILYTFFLFVISLELSLVDSEKEQLPKYQPQQTRAINQNSLKITRVKRCRPGGIDCRSYRLVAPCPPSICGPNTSPLVSSDSVIYERFVQAPPSVVEHYRSSSSSSSASSSSSSSSSSYTSSVSSAPIQKIHTRTEKLLQSPSKIVERRKFEKIVQKPIVQQKTIVEEYHAPVVQQKIEKIVQKPIVQQKTYVEEYHAPIVQQKIIKQPIVQQKTYVEEHHAPIVQQKIIRQPIVQQKTYVEEHHAPLVQQKIEKIVQKPLPVVQEKTIIHEHENIIQKPVKFEKIIEETHHLVQKPVVQTIHEEIHIKKPIVSLRITACPEGHFLSEDGTHCKHIDCDSGFEFSDNLLKCVDINECTVPTACLKDEQCINTYGSYICRKICTQAGFRLSEITNSCEDINECVESLHTCGHLQTCVNTPGSYRCECPEGFRIDGSQCVDINECVESHAHICPHDVSTCENTPGSYYCKCKRGFEKDHKGRCIDVDECRLNNGGCSQRCVNKYGSYECHCNDGYKLSADGHTCVDVDECVEYANTGICSPQVSTCHNTPGSYYCVCKTGFRDPDGSGKHCIDVDECAENTNLCEQKCINTFGSYKCACNRGYRPVGPHRCEDIDECHEGDIINDVSFSRFRHDEHGHPKLCQGGCQNTAGSYRCTCPRGYNLVHNHHCVDIDECREHGYCRGANQTCVNIGGSFRCVDDRCPPGYHKDGIQCKISERLSYAEICDDPTEVCDINRVICYSYAYIAFKSKFIQEEETVVTTSDLKGSVKDIARYSAPRGGKGHEFFTFVVPVDPPIIVDFQMRLVSVKSPRANVRPANKGDFALHRVKDNEVRLSMLSSLEGPQDIELEIEAKMYKNGLQIGKNVAIVMVFISEYEF